MIDKLLLILSRFIFPAVPLYGIIVSGGEEKLREFKTARGLEAVPAEANPRDILRARELLGLDSP